MNLREYIDANFMHEKKFAKHAGLSLMTLQNVLEGKGMNAKTARQIEIATKGKVKLKDLIEYCESKDEVKNKEPKKRKRKSSILIHHPIGQPKEIINLEDSPLERELLSELNELKVKEKDSDNENDLS